MRTFTDLNPIAVAVYFVAVSGIAMFCMNPLLLSLSLFGALLLFFVQNGSRHWRSHLSYLGLFLVLALINPIVSHNGVTVLFVVNDSPVTAEAIIYGQVASMMVIAVLYWFRSFTQIMTSDKLLYLFGKLSPKPALILSMALRYLPLFKRQAQKINQAQTGIGLCKDDNLIDRTKGGIRVFSVMVTWSLENGIITADSMSARGYGIGRRSHYSIFSFRTADRLLLLTTFLLSALTAVSITIGALDTLYYPAFRPAKLSVWSAVGYISYGLLVLFPTFIEAEEKIKWKYLQSKI